MYFVFILTGFYWDVRISMASGMRWLDISISYKLLPYLLRVM